MVTELLLNRPSFVHPTKSNVVSRHAQKQFAQRIYRAALSENEADRLRLIAAAERYEGADWSKFREI